MFKLLRQFSALAALAAERTKRVKAEEQLRISARLLSRQQAVLNDLMRSQAVRSGTLADAMRALSRALVVEAGIERVAISILEPRRNTIAYAEAFVAASGLHEPVFTTPAAAPTTMIAKARPGRILAADDVATSPDVADYYEAVLKQHGVKSLMQLPIEVDGVVVGIVNASTYARQITWSVEQKLFMTAVANLASLAVERDQRMRVEAAVQENARRLAAYQAAVGDFMRDTAVRQGTLTQSLQRLAAACAETLGVDRLVFWKCATVRDALLCVDTYDRHARTHTAGKVRRDSEEPLLFSALRGGNQITDCDVTSGCARIVVPIMSDGTSIGVVSAERTAGGTDWSQEDRLLLSTVANIAALVIERHERGKAEAEVAANAERLSKHLAAINRLMQSDEVRSGAIDVSLKALMTELCNGAGVDRVSIWVAAPGSQDVAFAKTYLARTKDHLDLDAPAAEHFARNMLLPDADAVLDIEDARIDPATVQYRETVLAPIGIRSVLRVPIVIDGNVTGYIAAATIERRIKWRLDQKLMAIAMAQLAALAIERDQRRRTESSLRHANRAAEAASQAKSRFLANMSHEIRTPMNGVFGMTDLLMQTGLTERQRRLVGTISNSAKTLLKLINDILDLSRIEAGRLELDYGDFDLRDCIEGAAELFAEEAQRKGIELTFYMSGEVPEQVHGDAGRLRQILINLIGNAIKFTRSGDVAVRVTREAADGSKVRLRFEIRDTGIGIEEHVREKLFSAFTQADSSISRRFGGTGLGLSISRHLVEMMQGTILLESEIGRGTVVTVHLPAEPAVRARHADPANHLLLAGCRILVVDDREINRDIAVDYLAGCGASIACARDGGEALAVLAAAAAGPMPFSAAVIDRVMPGMDGMELARRIKGEPGFGAVALIMLTSLNWAGDVRVARESGVGTLLTKPVRRRELLDAVARALAETGEDRSSHPQQDVPRLPASFTTHVLVAEDNAVNQEIACGYLAAMGCSFLVADNGLAAVEAFRTGQFDIVLMDFQMPEMDGLTAVGLIREIERERPGARTPIVAVTANAFEDDRMARDAGIDDHLCKPFSELQLRAMLVRWAPASFRHYDPAPVIDTAEMTSLRRSRPRLFERLLQAYMTHAPQAVAELTAACRAGSVEALRIAAHSLKSSSANVGAMRVADLARRLEQFAGSADIPAATALARELESEFAAARAVLDLELAKVRRTAN